MTKRADPLPKLRVTYLSCGEPPPQCAHCVSADIDSDDEELSAEADFEDDFCARPVERVARDDALDFARFGVLDG